MTSTNLITKTSKPVFRVKGDDLEKDNLKNVPKLNTVEKENRMKKVKNYFRAVCIVFEPIMHNEEFKPIMQKYIDEIQRESNSSKTGTISQDVLNRLEKKFEISCNKLINKPVISTLQYQKVIQIIHTLSQHTNHWNKLDLTGEKDKSKINWFGGVNKTESIQQLEIFLGLK